ncbi:MAG: septum formation initiator family protein [Bacteroidaceae bacterium]
MRKLLTIWNFICYHKYMITVAVFIVFVGFLDNNSIMRRVKYVRQINYMENEIDKYKIDYNKSTETLNEIESNPDAIEKIAREKYFMKKPNEDVYVFDDKK